VLGLLIYDTFLAGKDDENHMIEISTLVGAVIIFGVITVIFNEALFIFTTSIIGAYCMVRGVSFVAGSYPNEFTIEQELQDPTYEFPW